MQSRIWQPRLQPLSTPPVEPISELEVDNSPGRYPASALLFLVEHDAQVFERENKLCIIFPRGTTIQDLPRDCASPAHHLPGWCCLYLYSR